MGKIVEYTIKYFTAMRKSYQVDSEQLSIAIDTMRKYQQITEIVKTWEDDTWTDGISEDCMEKISEVVNGDDD